MVLAGARRQEIWGWPARMNFILGGMGAGFYLLSVLLTLPQGHPPAGSYRWIAPALVLLGLAALAFEAGRPLRSRFLLQHLRHSWMSRETLAAAVFVAGAGLDLIVPSLFLRLLAAAAATAFLASQGFLLYRARGVAAWNVPEVPALIITAGFAAGSGPLLLAAVWEEVPPLPIAAGAAALCLLAALAAWLLYLHRLRGTAPHLARELCRPRSLLLFVGGGHLLPLALLALLPARAAGAWLPVIAGAVIVFAGAALKNVLMHRAGSLRPLILARPGGEVRSMNLSAARRRTMHNLSRRPSFGPWKKRWARLWMRFAGSGTAGRCAARFASWVAPPHKERIVLARMSRRGYVEPTATLYHDDLHVGAHCFIGDRVMIFQRKGGGPVELGDNVYLYRNTTIETAGGGLLRVGSGSSIHPRCQINAYVAPIEIGSGVMIAPNCAIYSYNHGIAPDQPIRKQPLESNGPVIIGDEAWLGVGVTVLSGVRIGKGAVIGAGSLVTADIPDGAIAVGMPARVVKMRSDLAPSAPRAVAEGDGDLREAAFHA